MITMKKEKPKNRMSVSSELRFFGILDMRLSEPIERARPKTRSDKFSILGLILLNEESIVMTFYFEKKISFEKNYLCKWSEGIKYNEIGSENRNASSVMEKIRSYLGWHP